MSGWFDDSHIKIVAAFEIEHYFQYESFTVWNKLQYFFLLFHHIQFFLDVPVVAPPPKKNNALSSMSFHNVHKTVDKKSAEKKYTNFQWGGTFSKVTF